MLEKHYDYIREVCRRFTPYNHQDLAHDIIILLYEQKKKCEYLIKKGVFKGWLYVVIKNQFIDSKRRRKHLNYEEGGTCYYNVFKEGYSYFNTLEVKHYEAENYQQAAEELNDLMIEADLTYTERMWIETFLDHNLNTTWVSDSINVDWKCAKKNYNKALTKLKNAI